MKHVVLGRLRAYEVVSQERTTYSGSWDYEPPETYRDYRLVFARTAQRAKVLAVRSWRRNPRIHLELDENPFTGLRTFRGDVRCFMVWE